MRKCRFLLVNFYCILTCPSNKNCLAGNILAGQKHCMTELRFVWPVSDRPLLKNHFEHRLHDLLIYIKTQEDRYLQYGKA